MRWSAVKNLILGLLIAMNVFMLTAAVIKQLSSEKIPPLAHSAAVEAMKNSGIICAEELVPNKYMTASELKAQWFTASELSPMFFGEQLAFQTEGRVLTARQGGAVLRVEDNMFSYESGLEEAEADEKQFRKALKELGLNMSIAVYEGNGRFSCRYARLPVFGKYIAASLSEDGAVAKIEACWPKSVSRGRTQSRISVISCIPDVIAAFPQGGRVADLELGYELKEEENASASLLPAWRITMEDGRTETFVH